MRILVKYQRQVGFGNQTTIMFDIDPESLVVDLKRRIFARIGFEVKFQQLQVNFHGVMETMSDECSLSFYNIKENSIIQLENLQTQVSESEVGIMMTIWNNFLTNCVSVVNQAECAKTGKCDCTECEVHAKTGHRADEEQHQFPQLIE